MFVKMLDNERDFVYNGVKKTRNIVRVYMIPYENPFVNSYYKFLRKFYEQSDPSL